MTRAQRDQLIAEGLIKLSDRCGEALAAVEDPNAGTDNARENLVEINNLIWRLRWDVGPSGGAEAQLDRCDDESEAAQ
jgi:hypothetical protein